MFQRAWKVFRKFCPLCYKQVIALSPHRIKDKFSLVFSKFSQIALVAARLGQFCEDFENTRENLSLILLGPMRLHIQIVASPARGENRTCSHPHTGDATDEKIAEKNREKFNELHFLRP